MPWLYSCDWKRCWHVEKKQFPKSISGIITVRFTMWWVILKLFFQSEKYWLSNGWAPDKACYAIYLIKRSASSKARLELRDYEIGSLSKLQKELSSDWDRLVCIAESLTRAEKRKDASERRIHEIQERAFWNIQRFILEILFLPFWRHVRRYGVIKFIF